MPIIRVNGAALYYEEHGTGPETIVFAHGLLWSCRMFDAQVALLKDRTTRLRALPLSRPFDGRLYWLTSRRQAPRASPVVDPAGDFR